MSVIHFSTPYFTMFLYAFVFALTKVSEFFNSLKIDAISKNASGLFVAVTAFLNI